MAQYPIKMLKDEQGNPFVPLVSPEAVRDVLNRDWESMIKDKMDQLDPMPAPSEDLLNKIVQYKGTTTGNYTQGYFYKCVSDGASVPAYSWELVNVQDLSNYLAKDNSSIYNPISDYNPATKKYVDDEVGTKQNIIDSTHKLSADLIDDSSTTNKFVTASDKTNWNSKGTYSKPSGGIPSTDLASGVQTSLGKADTALQSSDLDNYLSKTNTTSYTPSANYHPATKKYVDDNIVNDTYSTSETATNKVWIDGKTIYRKVIYISAFPTYVAPSSTDGYGGMQEYDTGVPNMETPINMYGMYRDTSSSNPQATWPVCNTYNFSGADRRIDTRLRNDGTKVTITYGNHDFSNYKGYIILEYTKTTS